MLNSMFFSQASRAPGFCNPARGRHSDCRVTPRTGCTIAESLVAIVVFTIGGLSVAGSTAVVLRQLNYADVKVTSALAASSRFARLASARCDALIPGSSEIAPGLQEIWTVTPTGDGSARARIEVQFEPRHRVEVFEATILCR